MSKVTTFVKATLGATALAFGLAVAAPALAQDAGNEVLTLDQLLERVKKGRVDENRENARREAEFKRAAADQARLLREAEEEVKREEARSDRLEKVQQENEQKIAELQELLAERLGVLGELFGVTRQVAAQTAGHISSSLISAQYPGRDAFLRKLGGGSSTKLPTIPELEQLWYTIQKEMTEQGKVATFSAKVSTPSGEEETVQVTRIGTFVASSEGRFLTFSGETQALTFLGRQPSGTYTGPAEDLENADSSEYVRATVDPSRGAILGALIAAPDLKERIQQGGVIGYIIIGIAVLGTLMALERIVTLSIVGMRVSAQAKSGTPSDANALGRILKAYHDNEKVDVETLELKLDEAILREVPKLEARLSTLKTMAAIAPMLGLLGTVTGMIQTFQSITLFGTGDPKTMAGGISQALITTVLGLVAAIPVLFLHSLAQTRSRNVMSILEEQSAGLIAKHAEDHPHSAA